MRTSTVSILFSPIIVLLGAWAWVTDFVTIQGESTIYTVACNNGEWRGDTCTGALAASGRFRFRALPRRKEVLFWTPGKNEPSGRFIDCRIEDGRNWTCPPSADAPRTITLSLEHGQATHDATGRTQSFRAVSKWRWMLLRWGVPTGRTADY
ncbi:hypothetical protein [Ramlibacter alkalitolerans]|uniref:Uncharacterized protein n=1 Tax=Ramlibacter alkalitolerans TaxID=2039631 RepID=A0ABS1JRU2_9BURK|nr:hypothetical protein [Ramlibacter alkalitolerans]MBL0426973.1 hypothetical protein [Ramlibacter alkalitolerans]